MIWSIVRFFEVGLESFCSFDFDDDDFLADFCDSFFTLDFDVLVLIIYTDFLGDLWSFLKKLSSLVFYYGFSSSIWFVMILVSNSSVPPYTDALYSISAPGS